MFAKPYAILTRIVLSGGGSVYVQAAGVYLHMDRVHVPLMVCSLGQPGAAGWATGYQLQPVFCVHLCCSMIALSEVCWALAYVALHCICHAHV